MHLCLYFYQRPHVSAVLYFGEYTSVQVWENSNPCHVAKKKPIKLKLYRFVDLPQILLPAKNQSDRFNRWAVAIEKS